MLHIKGDEENWVRQARIHNDAFGGEHSYSYPNITEHPPEHSDNVWFNPETGAMAHPADTPNPYAYKVEQHRVIAWAHRHIHDQRFQAYARHGHQVRADIFHVFAVMNVMAALHAPNILGAHWGMVTSNMVSWQDFTRRIRIDDWTQSGVFNYATFIATPVNRFVPLRPSFSIGGVITRGTRQITIDPQLLSLVGDILPINQG